MIDLDQVAEIVVLNNLKVHLQNAIRDCERRFAKNMIDSGKNQREVRELLGAAVGARLWRELKK